MDSVTLGQALTRRTLGSAAHRDHLYWSMFNIWFRILRPEPLVLGVPGRIRDEAGGAALAEHLDLHLGAGCGVLALHIGDGQALADAVAVGAGGGAADHLLADEERLVAPGIGLLGVDLDRDELARHALLLLAHQRLAS